MSLIMTKKTWKKRSLDGFLTLTFLKRSNLQFQSHGLYNIHRLEVKKTIISNWHFFQGVNTLTIAKKNAQNSYF